MDAAAFLSAVIEIALAIAGFAGIVAAIRQRKLSAWSSEQMILLQILFTASAAAVVLGLLPALLMETGIGETNTWKASSVALLLWIVLALSFRARQSRKLGVENQIPKVVMILGLINVPLLIYNAVWLGAAWPFLFGIMILLMNGFSVFLTLILKPTPEEDG